jgi:hypothetical protein
MKKLMIAAGKCAAFSVVLFAVVAAVAGVRQGLLAFIWSFLGAITTAIIFPKTRDRMRHSS